jgi:hypothetical protein
MWLGYLCKYTNTSVYLINRGLATRIENYIIIYRVRLVLTPFFETIINLHKILKNNNNLMKLSEIVNL